MAVINFPDSPSDGDTQDVGGITYTYSSSKGYWTAAASGGGGGGGASVTTDDAAPSNPSDGDLWWDSDGGKMYVYYDDGASSQWVSVSVPGATGSTGPAGADGADGTNGVDGADGVDGATGATGIPWRNKFINGNFDIWQRGTSQTNNGYGSADMWRTSLNGSTATVSRQEFTIGQTDVPNNPHYYGRIVTTSSSGAGNFAIWRTYVEDVRNFAGETVTVSFWAKADAAKSIGVELSQIFGTGGSPSSNVDITPQTVDLTTTWTRYTKTFSVPSISGKTLGTTVNTSYLRMHLWLDAGSDYDSRSSGIGQQSGTFEFSQVQIESGSTASDFEKRPKDLELSLCRRYLFYNESYGAGRRLEVGFINSSTVFMVNWSHFNFRATPTISYNNLACQSNGSKTISAATTSVNTTGGGAGYGTYTNFTISGGTTGYCGQLRALGTDTYLILSAEL